MLGVRVKYGEARLVGGSLRLVHVQIVTKLHCGTRVAHAHCGDNVAFFSDASKRAAEAGVVAAEGGKDGPESLDKGVHAQIVTIFDVGIKLLQLLTLGAYCSRHLRAHTRTF